MAKDVKGQISLFPSSFIKDADCTKDTPVTLGKEDVPVYGKGIKIEPREPGRTDSEHFKKIYLKNLLPLEEYPQTETARAAAYANARMLAKVKVRNLPWKRAIVVNIDLPEEI